FDKREAASTRLFDLGRYALPQLREATLSDIEADLRAREIIRRVEQSIYSAASRALLLNEATSDLELLPGWNYFSNLTGSTRSSKLIYAEMLREQPEFTKEIELHSQGSLAGGEEAIRSRVEELANTLLAQRFVQLEDPELGDIATILVAVSMLEGQSPVTVNKFIRHSCFSPPLQTHMSRRGFGPVLRKLVSAWLPKVHAEIAFDAFFIALRDQHPTGADLARRFLQNNLDTRTLESGIQCLGIFGEESDLPRLFALLENDQICAQFDLSKRPRFPPMGYEERDESPPGAPEKGMTEPEPLRYQYRVQDLALAACMMVMKEDLRQAFPQATMDERFGIDLRSIAFLNAEEAEEKRKATLREWKEKIRLRIAEKQ
ncbi:MAG: hypothetical protein AAF483_25390, partial [Planctomycetota bacterium]